MVISRNAQYGIPISLSGFNLIAILTCPCGSLGFAFGESLKPYIVNPKLNLLIPKTEKNMAGPFFFFCSFIVQITPPNQETSQPVPINITPNCRTLSKRGIYYYGSGGYCHERRELLLI